MDPEDVLLGRRLVIVIPAYRARETLSSVLQRIPALIHRHLLRILIVEDGGENISRSVTPDLLQRYPKIEVLLHEHNKGYGAAQKTGYKRALKLNADLVALLHADGQYAPECLPELCSPLVRGEADIVLGSRMKNYRAALAGGMPLYKFIANISLSRLENFVYRLKLSEYHSGYMLYNAKALRTIPFDDLSDTFHFDGEMLLVGSKKGLQVADLPIPTHYGDEESHLKPIAYGFEVLGVIYKYLRGKYPI
jgi:glycosyltransferase involved in cell wall biosynthesis